MKNRLAVKLLLLLIIPISLALGFMEYLNLKRDINDLTNVEREKEAVLVDSIVKSIADRMMEGHPDLARRLLGELSTLEGITTLEVYRPNGTIAFEDLATLEKVIEKKKREDGASSLAETLETSRKQYPSPTESSGKDLLATYPSHRDTLLRGQDVSFMETQGGTTVLTLLRPLKNEKRCQGCHGTDNDIRGIVKISSSQEKNIARIDRHKRAMMDTIAIISLSLAIFLYLLIKIFIDRPLKAMVSTIQDIAEGDLTRQVEVSSRDEMGVMAENFNLMTAKLRQAQDHLKAWAEDLDVEVRRRTEELRKANEELKRADQMKSEFLANMSHELRTPLNAVIGFSEVLLDRVFGNLNEKQSKYIDNILTSGRHLLRLINNILDLSKIEAGRMDVHGEEFHLEKVIYEVLSIAKPLAMKKQIALDADLSDCPEKLYSDEGKLKQILYNLLSNAVKFTPEGGTVTVAVSKTDYQVHITVADTGIGISREHVAKIFREFYQVDSSHSRKYEGTGLGLALTKRFAELMGGEVAVESTVGAGSRFTITLPIKAQSIPPIPLPAQQPYHPRPELVTLDRHAQPDAPLILVVEDDAKASELLSIHLKQAGYGVVTASNGESAVRLAKELQPFAITLDIMLPKQDGWQVIQELKADDSTANIPVLVTSMLDDQNLAFSLGATDYFVKPVDKGRLLQRLGTISLSFNTTQGPATVLVVDDEPATLELLRATLEPVGYKVLTASGGADGIELARKHMPNIILLDLMMPEVSGFDVISALKESLKTRNIPIIIFTAKDLSREEIEELNADIENIYLKGDFEKSSLLEEIYRLEKIDPDRARMVDRLTGLPNYRYLKNRLMEESSRSDRYDRSFSLVMLDIDNFRQYNEANGSIIGDAAIKKVADLVKKTIRRCDIPTRYVDDKYFVVLPETGKSSAMVAAEKIRTAVEQFPFPYQEKLPGSSLTLSISVVHYSDDTDNLDQLVAFAQSAMGEAKKNGGNTVVFYKG